MSMVLTAARYKKSKFLTWSINESKSTQMGKEPTLIRIALSHSAFKIVEPVRGDKQSILRRIIKLSSKPAFPPYSLLGLLLLGLLPCFGVPLTQVQEYDPIGKITCVTQDGQDPRWMWQVSYFVANISSFCETSVKKQQLFPEPKQCLVCFSDQVSPMLYV